jgi:hypothetical protein
MILLTWYGCNTANDWMECQHQEQDAPPQKTGSNARRTCSRIRNHALTGRELALSFMPRISLRLVFIFFINITSLVNNIDEDEVQISDAVQDAKQSRLI